jgi:hypothetical protein
MYCFDGAAILAYTKVSKRAPHRPAVMVGLDPAIQTRGSGDWMPGMTSHEQWDVV